MLILSTMVMEGKWRYQSGLIENFGRLKMKNQQIYLMIDSVSCRCPWYVDLHC